MAIVTTVPHKVYAPKGLSGSRGAARDSRVRPRHAPESPSSLSRILMRPSTLHSLHAHSLTVSRYSVVSGRDARKYALADGRCDTEAAAAEAGGYIAPPDVITTASPP
ncbi:unnamed protein product, partial [Brenthis ino]